jgi:hypothetical protein
VVEDASHLFLMLHFHRKCNTFAHALTTTHTHPPPFPPPPPMSTGAQGVGGGRLTP